MEVEELLTLVLALAKKVKNLNKSRFEKVESLPLEGQFDIIYLLKHDDHYDEYVWLDTNEYEMIGTTEIDLSQYATLEEVYNLEVNKCERIRLTCDDNRIYRDEEVLTFEDVLALVMNKRYYVTMTLYDNISFRPSAYDGDAIWFDSTFIEDNTPNILRAIINSDNQFKIDQIELASLNQFNSLSRTLNEEITTRTNQVITLVNSLSIESERAQEQESLLRQLNETETERATLRETQLQGMISNVEDEIDALDICIDEKLWGNGESGYRKYRNGCLIQWGTTTSNANGEQEFTMHTPNTNQVFMLQVTPKEKGNFFSYGYPTANNKFACRIQDKDGTSRAIKYSWMSIGRWK